MRVNILFMLLPHRFVPESPRWLMAEGRFQEALKIMKAGAKTNGNTLPSDGEILEMMEAIHQEVRSISSCTYAHDHYKKCRQFA